MGSSSSGPGLPSFIVTLATMFIIAGMSSVLRPERHQHHVHPDRPDDDRRRSARRALQLEAVAQVRRATSDLYVSVVWWIVIALVGAYVLGRTQVRQLDRRRRRLARAPRATSASRSRGSRSRCSPSTAFSASILAGLQSMQFASADIQRGGGYELTAITMAVIGGCLLTGGYGSVAGHARSGRSRSAWPSIGHRVRLDQRRLEHDRDRDAAPARPSSSTTGSGAASPACARAEGARHDDVHRPLRPAPSPAGDAPPLLEARNISKYFGAVVALEDVSLTVRAGEINCLLGDNGAGKSTLIKTLSGVHPPDDGTLAVDGQPVQFGSPRDALNAGIATVYQDLSVMPLMSISRNFFLGNEPTVGFGPFRRFDSAKAARIAREEMKNIGIDVRDTEQLVGTLSGGERQTLAIARAEYFGARVLILDEPTSALGVKESAIVLRHAISARNTRPRRDLHHPQRPARPADRRLVHDPDPRPVRWHLQAGRAQRQRAAPPDGRRRGARGAPGRSRDARPARGARRGRPDGPTRQRGGRGRRVRRGRPASTSNPEATAWRRPSAMSPGRPGSRRPPSAGCWPAIGRARPETRDRVFEAARELGYRPSGVARSLRQRATRTLGLIVTDIENPFFPQLVRAVEDAARDLGYAILLCNAADDPEREAGLSRPARRPLGRRRRDRRQQPRRPPPRVAGRRPPADRPRQLHGPGDRPAVDRLRQPRGRRPRGRGISPSSAMSASG